MRKKLLFILYFLIGVIIGAIIGAIIGHIIIGNRNSKKENFKTDISSELLIYESHKKMTESLENMEDSIKLATKKLCKERGHILVIESNAYSFYKIGDIKVKSLDLPNRTLKITERKVRGSTYCERCNKTLDTGFESDTTIVWRKK